jgi:nucleotide-binding universal stress UspA family protein
MSSTFLVGLDGSPSSQKALRHALDLYRSGDGLHIASVAAGPDIEMADPDEREHLIERAQARCSQWVEDARATCQEHHCSPEAHVLTGQPAEELLGLAHRVACTHIVLGHRRKGLFEQLLMGSVAKRVVDFARCMVTVVR